MNGSGVVVHTLSTLETAVVAASKALGSKELILVGSVGPLLAAHPDAPSELRTSLDIDLFPKEHREEHLDADVIIGKDSPFRELHNFYVERLAAWTVMSTPDGWQKRTNKLVFGEISAYALSMFDTIWNKLERGEPKDISYCARVISAGLLKQRELANFIGNAGCSETFRNEPELFEASREAVQKNFEHALFETGED